MIITKIIIKNFGPHKETILELTEAITAIIGHNGAGKSFLLETVPAVFQGSFPTQGNFADAMTQGFLGEAYLSVEFEHNGFKWKAERKCKKTSHKATGFSQEAMLYKIFTLEKASTTIAGPKVKEFQEEIENMFGDSKIFFASVFAAQNNVGDIVEASATDRKRILGELLDLSKFQEKADEFRDLNGPIKIKLQSFEQSKAALEDSLNEIEPGYKEELLDNALDLTISKKTALDKIKEAEGKRDKVNIEIAKSDEIIAEKDKLRDQYRLKGIEINGINETLAGLAASSAKLIELKDAQVKIEILRKGNEEALKSNAKIQEVINANKDLRIKYADGCRRVSENRNEIENSIKDLINNNQTHQLVIDSIIKDSDNAKEALQDTVSLLKTGDFNYPQCEKCKFTERAFKAKEELENFLEPDVSEEQTIIDRGEEQIEIYRNNLKSWVDLPEPEYAEEGELEDLGEDLADHTPAIELLETTLKGESVLRDNLKRLEKEQQDILKAGEAISVPDNKENALEVESLSNEIIVLTASIEDTEEIILDQNRKVAAIEEKERKNAEIQATISEMESKHQGNIKQSRIYEYLQQAFGKSGIQALLIDSTIPNLQVISQKLLQIATNNRLQVQFSTEKQLKSGGTSESLEILCTDEKGTRDISQGFSGGEQKILRAAIRLTLAIYQTMRSKIKLQTLMVDEALDQLSPDNAEAVISMYSSLTEYFEKVLFISHSDELLVDFPNKVELKKINGRSVIL